MIVSFICSQIVAHFCIAKTGHLRCYLPVSTSGSCPINPKPSNNAVFVAALVLHTFLCTRQVSAESIPNLPTTRCSSLPSYSRPSSVHVRFLPNQSQTFQQRGVCRCPRTPDLPLCTSGFCPINPKPSNNAVFVAALVLQTFLCPRHHHQCLVPHVASLQPAHLFRQQCQMCEGVRIVKISPYPFWLSAQARCGPQG